MANYSNLIATIQSAIRQNGNGEITGQLLQTTLAAMVASLGSGFQYKGVATPATNPGSPDENVFYFAPAGTYPYFGNSTIPAGRFGVLRWAVGGSWVAETLDGVGGSALSFVAVASVSALPDPGVDGIGYLVGENLYLYVGTGGDTAGGKYQNMGAFRGPQGPQGNSGYTGAAGELEVVNNLTDGGATAALSAEMGKDLGLAVFGRDAEYEELVWDAAAIKNKNRYIQYLSVKVQEGDTISVKLNDYSTYRFGITVITSNYYGSGTIISDTGWKTADMEKIINATEADNYCRVAISKISNAAISLAEGTAAVQEMKAYRQTAAPYESLIDKVDDLYSVTGDLHSTTDDLYSVIGNPVIDLDNLTIQNCTLGVAGWYAPGKHIAFPVTPGEALHLKLLSGAEQSFYAFVNSSYSPPYLSGATIPFVSGETARVTVPLGTSLDLTAPEDAAYLILVKVDGAGNTISWSLTIDPTEYDSTIFSNIADIKEQLGDIDGQDLAPTQSIPFDLLNSFSYVGQRIELGTKQYTAAQIGTLSSSSNSRQGAAVFGNYFFQFTNKLGVIVVFDLSTGQNVQTITLTENPNNHAGSGGFGKSYYNTNDPFPLLYISSMDEKKIYVYRLTGEVGSLSISLVQTITLDVDFFLPNVAIDAPNNRAVVFGYTKNSWNDATDNNSVVCHFQLPPVSAGDVTTSDIEGKFIFSYLYAQQGGVAQYGKLYLSFGNTAYPANGGGGLVVINYVARNIDSFVDFQSIGNFEPEGIGIWDSGLALSDQNGIVRKVTFD